MKNLEFPIIAAKVKGLNKKFDLNSPKGRKLYFEAKIGDEIKHLKKYLEKNSFVAYWIGKKNAGKGVYSRMFMEIFGEDKVEVVSVGDLIREADDWENFKKTKKYGLLQKYYRGYVSFEDAVKAHLSRSTTKLLPTEFVLALLKAHLDGFKGKTIFIDGLPRDADQVSYSLYFRDLIAYRDDPDMFILIDVAENIIDERIKHRVVCPKCKTSRNIKLLLTEKIEYDEKTKEFYLVCDDKGCRGARMLAKEGDEKGLEPIRERLEKDDRVLRSAFALYGIPKVLLRNHIPVKEVKKYFDNYEITPEYSFKLERGKIKIIEKPWIFKDDNGIDSCSLLAPPVVVSMIKQMVEVLEI